LKGQAVQEDCLKGDLPFIPEVNVPEIGKIFRGHVITVVDTRMAQKIFERNAEDTVV
jgi:hypothetical protein